MSCVQSNILPPSYSEAINNNHQNYLLFPNSPPPPYYYNEIFCHSHPMLTSDVFLMKNKNGDNIIQCVRCKTISGTIIKELYHNWDCAYNKYNNN